MIVHFRDCSENNGKGCVILVCSEAFRQPCPTLQELLVYFDHANSPDHRLSYNNVVAGDQMITLQMILEDSQWHRTLSTYPVLATSFMLMDVTLIR